MGQPLWLSLRPNLLPTLHLRPGTDITMVVGQDIMEDTGDTMDGAATTDTPTGTDITVWDMAVTMVDTTDILTDTVTSESGLLMPNPKLMPNPRLRPNPGTTVMVDMDTMVIPTDTDTHAHTDTMVVTGGKLSVTIPSHLV